MQSTKMYKSGIMSLYGNEGSAMITIENTAMGSIKPYLKRSCFDILYAANFLKLSRGDTLKDRRLAAAKTASHVCRYHGSRLGACAAGAPDMSESSSASTFADDKRALKTRTRSRAR